VGAGSAASWGRNSAGKKILMGSTVKLVETIID
jgi:hypothetical protein